VTDRRQIAFRRIADAALRHADVVVRRWLPNGRREGVEWVCRNPRRDDRRPGSFKINLINGRWADFAHGARGGDLIGLASYLYKIPPGEAAKRIAEMIGVSTYDEA
jgi:hypothetical protein